MFKLFQCILKDNCGLLNKNIVLKSITVCTFSNKSGINLREKASITTPRAQSVSEYYAGKKVFITGGTGFVGKVLIQRLLTNCKDIDTLYVLIRQKSGQNVQERLKSMLNVPLFDNLKKVNPASLNKIVPIPGDMMKSKLGISLQDEDKLIDNVFVVFHSAATVKFTDTFKTMICVNLEGTAKALELGKRMKNLDTFVYISTAFSNSDKAVIDEVIYPPPKPLDEVYKFIEKHDNDEERIKKFIGGLPNTYTFSKAFCESLVDKEHGNMRTIIVRPSIVTPSVQDPPGWCDSWVAATATFSDVSRGLTRVLYGRPDVPCNTIPVDYVCNLTLVAAARQNPSKDVLVYNCCGDPDNIVTWKRGADMYLEESLKYDRVPGTLKPGKVVMSPHPLVVRYLRFTRQTVPALLADCWLRIQGKQPRHLKAVQRAALLTTLLQSFTSTRLDFRTTRSRHLMDTMSEEDKVLFPCDPKTIIWKNYMKDFYCGVQKYLLNNK